MAGGGSSELRELREDMEILRKVMAVLDSRTLRLEARIEAVKVRLDELQAEKAPEVKVMGTKVKAKPRRRSRGKAAG